MPVESIISALAQVAKRAKPDSAVYEALPESVGRLPAILFWPGHGTVDWPRANTYTITHEIEVRLLFSRADQPASDEIGRAHV